MTRQELVSIVVELGKKVSEYGAVRYATGRNPVEENYNKSTSMYSDILDDLATLSDNVLEYLPFEEKKGGE